MSLSSLSSYSEKPKTAGDYLHRIDERDAAFLNSLASRIHRLQEKWWFDPATGDPVKRNVGEMLMLVTSELAEALEYHRKGDRLDDKLVTRRGLEVELADAIIRLLDMAHGLGMDIGGALVDKVAYNEVRSDHKPESRLAPGGKAY